MKQHDVRLNLRVDNKAYNTLQQRAKQRGAGLSEYLRRLILLGLSLDGADSQLAARTKQIQRELGKEPTSRMDTTVIGDEIEYVKENPTSEHVRSVLESKGLYSPREKKRTGVEFRADGHRK